MPGIEKIESGLMVVGGQWGRGTGSDCRMGVEFPLGAMALFWSRMIVVLHNLVNVLNDPERV